MSFVNHEWLPVLTDLTDRGVPCVLITVMEAKGSTPRESGTKMIVTDTAQFGTIGGGNLEFQAIDEARKILAAAADRAEVRDYALGPSLAQCCGGAVSVFLEPFMPLHKTLFLFGAGHVGKEVIKVLEGLPLRIKWIDERENEFPSMIPANCERIVSAAPGALLRDAADDSFIVIMTHSHDLDYELVEAAMKRGVFSYLGLIGSQTKRTKFEKRLQVAGIAKEELSRLTCPIGIGGVMGKHPREIAIALAAELLSSGLTRGFAVEKA
ncbi:MAG: xanthine dehydrogenase accessory protein XdhC [Alphaproteobacteria bacterium]|nr:xanthine dehydrogenase accessory protein XdhC [Alphaproteobacteria bacterium]